MIIKRIIGLPGDIVRTRNDCKVATFVKVPPDYVWVEGDAGEGKGLDSNHFGPVPVRMLRGWCTYVFYPFQVAGKFRWQEYDIQHRIIRDPVLLRKWERGRYRFGFKPLPEVQRDLGKAARWMKATGKDKLHHEVDEMQHAIDGTLYRILGRKRPPTSLRSSIFTGRRPLSSLGSCLVITSGIGAWGFGYSLT